MAPSDRGENDSHMAVGKPLLPPTSGSSSSYTHQHDEFGEPKNKKRAKSIDIDEANQPSIAKLSLYTPTTARSDGPRELICLCAKAPKVPRPRNAFILYRQAWQGHFAAQHPGLANPEISKLIGEKWREQPESVKNEWKQLADEEKIRHQRQYPGYRYQPRRGGKNSSGRPTSSSGDAPGRCPKCGGRYIATPRTPTTPFRVASPPSSKRPTNMQHYTNVDHQRHDYQRHGSISGGSMQVDPHARRYTQPQLRDIEEDYSAMSPIAAPHPGMPPDTKRRRYNGPPVYVPASPHMGYAPVDPRYQQHPAMGGPPVSATGYGPGHLPRAPLQHRPGHYAGHTANTHMQPPPPPRPSMSYQAVSTPNHPNSGFDESLRLPPLQAQVNESPVASTEPSTRQTMVPAHPQQTSSTGLTIANQASGSVRQQQQPQAPPPSASSVPQKWTFLFKLDVLRSISPPLRPPGQGGPHFDTRGPIIAVEGAPTQMLKDVAAVIERALSVSAEFAVRVWSEDTSTTIAHSSPEPHASSSGSSEANNNNNKEGGVHGGNTAALQKKSSSLISPIANYVARILKWHKTSEDLIRYITSFPPDQHASGSSDGNGASSIASPSNHASSPSHRLPVAIISDGYSLTFSDRYASALHVNDAYRPDDHWQWVATMWRGVVGADLTVYVKRPADDGPGSGNGAGSVEIACPGVMVLRVPDAGRVDEKLERRLGFEIAEWVRGGSFTTGLGKM
ncbi:hypothetical protein F5B22DRAFT_645121 [Xylaria bambusicola]|uniref:uncharacterized protein n=1 Tax=Xylaria bambusicola TaxID=326684 RepID=UPI0020079AB7|nr:uncharacterized protein F5B22DRAFT_645121 [Xylaria bambusicola]KAI0518355.1 hypothetical protein F5B22DRAFT_645121 [Xylaria bambusicola]